MLPRSDADVRLHSIPGDRRLDGWKEIAAYLNKDVTTIQRWEKREGLPVHRHLHERLGTVYAFSGELQEWIASRRRSGADRSLEGADRDGISERLPAPSLRSWPWVGAFIAAATALVAVTWWTVLDGGREPASPARPRTLVVLPCRPIEGHESDRAYCDGLTDILIGRLTPLAGAKLLIVPASEIRRTRVQTTADARKLLQASVTLEGVLQRSGDRIQVTWSLVDVGHRAQIDSFTHTAASADLFDLQDRIAAWATRAVGLDGSTSAKREVRTTSNSRAYELYVQGRGYLIEYQRAGAVEAAVSLFGKAVGEDPAFAMAHAGLGLAYLRQFELTRSSDWIARAESACAEAYRLQPATAVVELCRGALANAQGRYDEAVPALEAALVDDPMVDEAYLALGQAQEAVGATAAAEATYRRAIAGRPGYSAAHMWLGRFYRGQHRYDEAIAEYERAAELTPDNGRAQALVAGLQMFVGRYAQALDACARALALGEAALAYNVQGMIYVRLRRLPDAIASLEHAIEAARTFVSVGNLARVRHWNGEREAARQLFEEAAGLADEELRVNPRSRDARVLAADYRARLGQPERALGELGRAAIPDADPHLLWFAALVHNQVGDRPAVLAHLTRAVANGLPASELENWPELDSWWTDPAFQSLLAQSKSSSGSRPMPRR